MNKELLPHKMDDLLCTCDGACLVEPFRNVRADIRKARSAWRRP